MKILILIDPIPYPYHQSLAENICEFLNNFNHTVSLLDIHSEPYDYLILKKIKELCPDVLITLDLAGFHFRTQAGENALNMLTTKNLNIIWGNKPEYALPLSRKISLSMLFYDAAGRNFSLPEHYPNMHYYKFSEKFYIDINSEKEPDCQTALFHIWKDFTAEVLLSET